MYLSGAGVFFLPPGRAPLARRAARRPSVNKYVLIFDGYLGKGCFWIFWGFLLFSGGGSGDQIGWTILALVYIIFGVIFICAFCSRVGPIHHLSGDRPDAKDTTPGRAPGRGNTTLPPDPYLANHPGATAGP